MVFNESSRVISLVLRKDAATAQEIVVNVIVNPPGNAECVSLAGNRSCVMFTAIALLKISTTISATAQ